MINLNQHWQAIAPAKGFASLRLVTQHSETISCRRGVIQPPSRVLNFGAMISVICDGGYGYAATSDLSRSGLQAALQQAQRWAKFSQGRLVGNLSEALQGEVFPAPVKLEHIHHPDRPWKKASQGELMELTKAACADLKCSETVSHWEAFLLHREINQRLLTNTGGDIQTQHEVISPGATVVVSNIDATASRTFFANDLACQGGLEKIDELKYLEHMPLLAEEAHQLAAAPMCPSETLDLLIHPDQMHLQIHESIGHPIELDRILGDERNYAGTSFVSQDMIGHYQYGSPLLNITFDPTDPIQLASYPVDDDGMPARKQYLIEKGILKRAIGGHFSAARAGEKAVACSRANNWNRPPIDRMANINLEPGNDTFAQMIAAVDRGLYVKTNCSWSIDDSRNKFQFGCEWGQLIEKGKLTSVVRNPNYRGVSASFWRKLVRVGNKDTGMRLSTLFCGKGEPNQAISVSHKTPHALFSAVDVFGGMN